MRLLAIDPGSHSGWAIWENGDVIHAGTWDLSCDRFEGAGMRYLKFEKAFRAALQGVTLVAYEKVQRHGKFDGTAAAHVYGGITAHLMRICEETGIPYTGICVQDIKKVAAGHGNASKEEMVAAANRRWHLNLNVKSGHDEADARWIAVVAAASYSASTASTNWTEPKSVPLARVLQAKKKIAKATR